MSAESILRAALVAEPTLIALVGQRVVQNGINEGAPTPYVVFTATHAPETNLLGDILADTVTFTVECWATSAFDADAVADAILRALARIGVYGDPAYFAASDYVLGDSVKPFYVLSRASGFDGDLGLDATVLSVEYWT